MIKNSHRAQFPRTSAGRRYFGRYRKTIDRTTFYDSSLERYCYCAHFEYKNDHVL